MQQDYQFLEVQDAGPCCRVRGFSNAAAFCDVLKMCISGFGGSPGAAASGQLFNLPFVWVPREQAGTRM